MIDRELTPEMREKRVEEMIEDSIDNMDLDPSKKEFEVFLGVNIPTNLFDMNLDVMERDIKKGNFDGYIYSTLLGLKGKGAQSDVIQEKKKANDNEKNKEEIFEKEEVKEESKTNQNLIESENGMILEIKNNEIKNLGDDDEIEKNEVQKEIQNVEGKLRDLIVMDETDKFGEVVLQPKEKTKKAFGDVKYGHLTKKERKKLVKQENRERRKNKMPKKLKKKLVSQKGKSKKK